MPSKFSCRQLRETGQSFENFLVVRGLDAEKDRERLRTVYNGDFKISFGNPIPGFSSMLYGMKIANLAYVTRTRVRFFKLNQTEEPLPENRKMKPMSDISKQHKSLLAKIYHDRAEYLHGKYGVDVEVQGPHEDQDGHVLIHLDLNCKEKLKLRLRNGGVQPVTLIHVLPFSRSSQFAFSDGDRELPCWLGPGECYELVVHCETSCVGYYPATVLWELLASGKTGSEQAGTFYIARFLAAVTYSPLAAQLKPTTPFKQARVTRSPVVTSRVEAGEKPDRAAGYDLELTMPLGRYFPPDRLRQHFSSLQKGNIFTAPKEIKAQLEKALEQRNYRAKFQLLLHLEELQMEHDIRQYDLEAVTMTQDTNDRNPSLLTLEVPGVAESRPSVLRGDHLFARLTSEMHQENAVTYKGFVHRVELDRVKLSFSTSLLNRFVNGLHFNVNFTFNRQPLQVQHRALELAGRGSLWPTLFPSAARGVPLMSSDVKLTLYDRSLESNPEQMRALMHIVMGTTRPAPYVIFGPPGTGKTVTLVEAIKQVVKLFPEAHVLACAPSNSGADLLCQRLQNHLPRLIYRLIAPSRDIRFVPEDIKPYCNWDAQKKLFVFPAKKQLQEYRVLITTLITASRLVSAEFPIDHFTHIFIDEAGQSVESESLVAIAGLLEVKESGNPGGQLVLAGDPRQLGPVLRSPLTRRHGLGLSLLERLLTTNSLYRKGPGGYNSQFITKLLRNYRSHPTILHDFPIIFHGIMGKDEREGNSPSFFNPEEVATVITYLKKLLVPSSKKGKSRLSPRNVGIISPYRKQVGSVEEFQGQERSVILVSTVRSSQSFVQLDLDFKLGFLKNPKVRGLAGGRSSSSLGRFNVAVTRAKALLIVIGNPLLLGQDPDWNEFLTYCKEKGGYIGCPYPTKPDLEQGQDLLQELSKLRVSTSGRGQWGREGASLGKGLRKADLTFFPGPQNRDYIPGERNSEGSLYLQPSSPSEGQKGWGREFTSQAILPPPLLGRLTHQAANKCRDKKEKLWKQNLVLCKSLRVCVSAQADRDHGA
ncbi:LOW QUALITY PROTEIN: Helicase MOV-10 [Galemys pyrenaicus]|uniref:RNA helicase n=1 Tax=Galemys pyrenaicus TaxID=202257 RepID=A0A8J6AG19_GALPY|nr:LOW QUALITY PROTEIN: Helicase MOV-10 [Galemys pyrenaicus]